MILSLSKSKQGVADRKYQSLNAVRASIPPADVDPITSSTHVMAADASTVVALAALVRALNLDDHGQRSGEPPALQITRITDKPSKETVDVSEDLAEDAALRALILNLDASERLSIEVGITDVNEFSGLATLSISKVSFLSLIHI